MKLTTKFSYTAKVAEPDPAWPFPKSTDLPSYNIEDEPLICHVISETGKGGATFAYRKTSDYNNANMVEVAVVYCSDHDVFTKKIGTALAKKAWNSGGTILVPARTQNDDYTIPHNLRSMFWFALGKS